MHNNIGESHKCANKQKKKKYNSLYKALEIGKLNTHLQGKINSRVIIIVASWIKKSRNYDWEETPKELLGYQKCSVS